MWKRFVRMVKHAGMVYLFTVGAALVTGNLAYACGGPAGLAMGLMILGAAAGAFSRLYPREVLRHQRRLFRAAIRARRLVYVLATASRGLAERAALSFRMLLWQPAASRVALVATVVAVGLVFGAVEVAEAATSPWVTAVTAVCQAFTGVVGKGLAIVAVIVGGLMFAFGEGGSKSAVAGLIFGAGMVMGAPNFLAWVGLGTAACT